MIPPLLNPPTRNVSGNRCIYIEIYLLFLHNSRAQLIFARKTMINQINNILRQIKNTNPLILNLTNMVTIDFIANGLLSLGASPLMSQAPQEMLELMQLTQALVINIGTLHEPFIELCHEACRLANQLNKPIILDPVGAGASLYRTEACQTLLKNYRIAIIRANASEVMALAGLSANTKGVDSTASSNTAVEFAQALSKCHDTTVCMSGKTDIIVDHHHIHSFSRGSELMPRVTGTGCLLSAVVGAFHAAHENRFNAAAAASLFYSICGEMAAKESAGPGSFKMNFLDALQTIPVLEDYAEAS